MLGRLISLIVIFLYTFYSVVAQEEAMRVERCSAIDPDAAVQNIYVDKDNNKWVSNDEGLWQVHAADLATPLILGSAESSLLQYPDGNGDIRWTKGAINDLLGGALSETNNITSGFYNEIQDHLWIGTAESGIFLFRTQPNLRWVKEMTRRMPKLRSNHINMIYVDIEDDRHFMGTDEGVVVGRDNRWGLEERYFRFQAVTNKGSEVWLLAEDIIWVVDKNDNWRTVEIDPEQVRGSIKDIAFDREGKLWVASEFLTVYDPENNKYKIFDGADYFTSNDVNCLAVDREGAVWVGTQDKGLFVIEKETAMTVTALLQDELSCDPANDNASLIVKIKGGQPPYSYAWEGGLSGDNPTNLGPGSYIVTVTDATGQSKPAEGVVPDTRLKVAVTQTKPHDESSRGAASTKIEGGKPKFTFLWDNGENGPTAERLEAGPHSVSITDANGCKTEGSVVITSKAGELALALEQTSKSACAGENENAIKANISGGISPYEYKWSAPSMDGDQVQNIAPGIYQLTVTDSRGATASASINIQALEGMTAKTMIIAQATPGNADGRASVSVDGGSGKYKYQWDNGETKSSADKLPAGAHTVTVTDQNNCAAVAEVEITNEIGELVVGIETTSKSICAGDGENAAKAIIRGGEGPYDIKWSQDGLVGEEVKNLDPGIHYVTVTDQRGVNASGSINIQELEGITAKTMTIAQATPGNADGRASVSVDGGSGKYKYQWDNGETKSSASKLAAGAHTVTVTDQNDCAAEAQVEITNEIGELVVSIETTGKSICAGDGENAAKAIIKGGEGPYDIKWSQDGLVGEEVKNLDPGIHYVTVTDKRGVNATASINFEELQPLKIEASVHAAATANNQDGRASVKVNGGTGKYTYAWSNGETTSAANALAPGKHTVTVSDEANCTSSAAVEITENISAMALVVNQTADIKCNGDETGAIEAVISGGKGPFKFVWNDSNLQGERSDGLSAGNFAATVTDAAGNIASASIILEEPTALEAEIVEQRGVTDEASKDGKAQIIVSGGTAPYTYRWDTQHTGDKVENLSIGDHSVTVTDANACELIITFETEQKILPQLSLNKLKNGQVVQMQMLQFAADSTNVSAEAQPILDEVYTFLKDNPGIVIRVAGHTNNTPSDEYCDRISTARAKSVAEYIVQKGVAGERVYFRGYGKREPMYSNLTPTGREKNQRVEIQILEVGEGS